MHGYSERRALVVFGPDNLSGNVNVECVLYVASSSRLVSNTGADCSHTGRGPNILESAAKRPKFRRKNKKRADKNSEVPNLSQFWPKTIEKGLNFFYFSFSKKTLGFLQIIIATVYWLN
jgi:hypothetical protein